MPATETSYTVELPLPLKGSSKNVRTVWQVRHRANLVYRAECALAYRAAKIPALGPVCLSLAFYNARTRVTGGDGKTVTVDDGRYRPLDEANAITSFAAGQDALVDAGIIPKDSRKYVRQGPVTIYGTHKEHRGKCGVVLTITPIEQGVP